MKMKLIAAVAAASLMSVGVANAAVERAVDAKPVAVLAMSSDKLDHKIKKNANKINNAISSRDNTSRFGDEAKAVDKNQRVLKLQERGRDLQRLKDAKQGAGS